LSRHSLADCFCDVRCGSFIKHTVATLVDQRVLDNALGCEDLTNHDGLLDDPLMSVMCGKREAWRPHCAAVTCMFRLSRLELLRDAPTQYIKIAHDPAAIEGLFVAPFIEAHAKAPKQVIVELVPPMICFRHRACGQ
jgi:hypothetical protein